MGDNSKVNLVRPDGTMLQATPEQAGRLKLLGYQEENPDERFDRNVEEGRSNYYSTAGQKVITGLEGVGSSLTLGGTDYLFGDEDTQARAQYNPGTRMAGEILGALVPLAMGDGAGLITAGEEATTGGRLAGVARTAVEHSPLSLVSDGARAVIGEGKGLLPAVMRGGLEGAAFGEAGAADHAYLSGDPLTAEAVLHGVGWGALFGAGLSAVGEGVEALGNKEAASEAAVGGKTTAAEQTAKVSEEAYSSFHSEVTGLKDSLKTTLDQADNTVSRALERLSDVKSGMSGDAIDMTIQRANKAYERASEAIKAGDAVKAESAMNDWQSVIKGVAKKMDISDQGNVQAALSDLADTRAVHAELGNIPKTVEEFQKLTPARAEKVFATLDKASKLTSNPVLSQAVNDALEKFTVATGVGAKGVDGLRGAWTAMRAAPMKAAGEEGPGLARRALATMVGAKAGKLMREKTGSSMLGFGAYKAAKNFMMGGAGGMASSLLAARNSVLGAVKHMAAEYLPAAGRALQKAGPRISPLAMKLDGTLDNSTKDQRELALRRIQEISQAGTHVNDTLYRAIEPIKATQPELGPQLHKAALSAFQALQAMAPKDPGAISRLKTLYKPDPAQADVLSRQLEVFHDPVAAAQDMLKSGRFDPVKVEALQQFAPEIYQQLRTGLMETVTKPGVMDKMSYQDQVVISALLDIPTHSSMAPQFIASQQQLFLQRNQPNPTPRVSMPGGSNGGRPPGPAQSKDSTASQRITEH